MKWKNLSHFAIFILYVGLFGSWIWKGSLTVGYGSVTCFWSVGKIAMKRDFRNL